MGQDRVIRGAIAVVNAFGNAVPIRNELHFWVVLFLVGDGGISPQIMQRHR